MCCSICVCKRTVQFTLNILIYIEGSPELLDKALGHSGSLEARAMTALITNIQLSLHVVSHAYSARYNTYSVDEAERVLGGATLA